MNPAINMLSTQNGRPNTFEIDGHEYIVTVVVRYWITTDATRPTPVERKHFMVRCQGGAVFNDIYHERGRWFRATR